MRLAVRFNHKARQRRDGLENIFEKLKALVEPGSPVVWVHAASLGEFEQGRPVIEALRVRRPDVRILLTFFSPSGYEVRRGYDGADWVFYLPADTPRNARRFVRTVRPQAAIFIKYEFWLNYMRQLSKVQCRTFLVSAIFNPDQIFFKPYGGVFRRGLAIFERLFVQDAASALLLDSINIRNNTVSGDTRFDRVAAVAAAARRIDEVERFAAGARIVVAGSTWPPDEHLIADMARRRPGLKFIIAPHEMDQARIERFIASSPRPAVRYTDCRDGKADPAQADVMVVDTIGILSSLYRYGAYAYIGGGFGVGIHNTLEAAAFGIPVAFGPNYHRFREARELVDSGAAISVESADELDKWMEEMEQSPKKYKATCDMAANYISKNKGATEKIINHIFP